MSSTDKRYILNSNTFAIHRSQSLSPSHKRIKSESSSTNIDHSSDVNISSFTLLSPSSFSISTSASSLPSTSSISSSLSSTPASFSASSPFWSVLPSVLLSLTGSYLDLFSLLRSYQTCSLWYSAYSNEASWIASRVNLIDLSSQPVKCHFEFDGHERTVYTVVEEKESINNSITSPINDLPISSRLTSLIQSISHVRHLSITSDTGIYLPSLKFITHFQSLETLQLHLSYQRYKYAFFPYIHLLEPKHPLSITLFLDIKWSDLHTLSSTYFLPSFHPLVTFTPHIHLRAYNGSFPHDGNDAIRRLSSLKGLNLKREGYWIQDEHFKLLVEKLTDAEAEYKAEYESKENPEWDEKLNLHYHNRSTITSSSQILLPFPLVDTLSLAGHEHLTYRSIAILSQYLPSLTSLTLTSLRSLNSQAIRLFPTIPKLAILSVMLNHTIDDTLLIGVLRSIPTLHTLHIFFINDNNNKITKTINLFATIPPIQQDCKVTQSIPDPSTFIATPPVSEPFIHTTSSVSSLQYWKSGPLIDPIVPIDENNISCEKTSILMNCQEVELYVSSISPSNLLIIHLFSLPYLLTLKLRRYVHKEQDHTNHLTPTHNGHTSQTSHNINNNHSDRNGTSRNKQSNKLHLERSNCISTSSNTCGSSGSSSNSSKTISSITSNNTLLNNKSSLVSGWDRSDSLNLLFYLKNNFDYHQSNLRILEIDIDDDMLVLLRENLKWFCIKRSQETK